jgi:hypothetical protein
MPWYQLYIAVYDHGSWAGSIERELHSLSPSTRLWHTYLIRRSHLSSGASSSGYYAGQDLQTLLQCSGDDNMQDAPIDFDVGDGNVTHSTEGVLPLSYNNVPLRHTCLSYTRLCNHADSTDDDLYPGTFPYLNSCCCANKPPVIL